MLCRFECVHCGQEFKAWMSRNIHQANCSEAPHKTYTYEAYCANGHLFTQSPSKPFCRCGSGLDLGYDRRASFADKRPQWKKRPARRAA